MANSGRVRQWFSSISDRISEQEAFQQLKSKWEELDSQSKTYLKFLLGGIFAVTVIFVSLSFIWSVHSLKSEVVEKTELLSILQSANDELKRLKDLTSQVSSETKSTGPWAPYFESLATGAGIEKTALSSSPEKAGAPHDLSKESLFDLSIKHVTIKQTVRFAFGLESGGRPVKIRHMEIDTKADPAGYMDATLAISAFNLVNK
ncbi:hypothetical protein WDW86_09040 [Bdellovibrionota bacterium FG-2]